MDQHNPLAFAPDFEAALKHFKTQPGYAISPLRTEARPDGGTVFLKDETSRMGLGAFKALGGPYAIARLLQAGWDGKGSFESYAAQQTFVTASAGNHGMGVAAGAQAAGARARIYLAETVPPSFDSRLKAYGAEVVRAGATYEDSVEAAEKDTEATGATLLADGTWPGYTEIPKLVMEGYTVIAEELRAAFETSGDWPSHIFVQAGVGGLACAMAYMIRLNWSAQPEIIIVEPEAAPCLKASHEAGAPVRADGPVSDMGRLDCKEVSIVAWDVLERCDVRYLTLSEDEGAAAARSVTAMGVPTTPSGAAGYGGLLKSSEIGPNDRPLVVISERA